MKWTFIVLSVFACIVFGVVIDEEEDDDGLVTLGTGELVRMVDNCTVGDTQSCATGYCCTKKILTYNIGYRGPRPTHEYKCEPLRQRGEFCYLNVPENYCPCLTRCHSNGFFGSCL